MLAPAVDEAPSPRSESEFHASESVMGTVVTIDVFDDEGIDATVLGPLLENARAALHDADRTFSTWDDSSPMSRIRRGELRLLEAPPQVAEVLADCLAARSLSGGWFDPWALPGGVDPTGYVKGWAAERALRALAPAGVSGAIVNAAGDVASFGGTATGAPFRIGIADPFDTTQLACVIELRGAVATSGTYERGAHLVDPHTGNPATRFASASVCGPHLGIADALATALAVGGDEVLARIEALDGYDALAIGLDGSVAATSAFPFATGR